MPRKRAPDGVVYEKPIALRLLPDELAHLKEVAAKEQRPLSNMSRLIVIRALAHHQKTGHLPD